MMKLMSNDEVDKLKLNKIKLMIKKRLRKRKRTSIQKKKLIETPFAKCISSEGIYILTLCYQ